MDEKDLSWLAGFFEGDGSFREFQGKLEIVITQKHIPTLVYIQKLLGFGHIRHLVNNYGSHYARLEFTDGARFYKLLRPYMRGHKAIELDALYSSIYKVAI